MSQLFQDVWHNKEIVVLDNCNDVTLPVRWPLSSVDVNLVLTDTRIHTTQIALFVVGAAGKI